MGFEAFLRGLVVVGHHHQGAIGSEGSRLPGGLHRLGGAVAAAAGDQFGPARQGPFDRGKQGVLLGPTEGGGFAGGAAHHQPIGALVHQVGRQAGRQGEIQRPVGAEWGHHRGE